MCIEAAIIIGAAIIAAPFIVFLYKIRALLLDFGKIFIFYKMASSVLSGLDAPSPMAPPDMENFREIVDSLDEDEIEYTKCENGEPDEKYAQYIQAVRNIANNTEFIKTALLSVMAQIYPNKDLHRGIENVEPAIKHFAELLEKNMNEKKILIIKLLKIISIYH